MISLPDIRFDNSSFYLVGTISNKFFAFFVQFTSCVTGYEIPT